MDHFVEIGIIRLEGLYSAIFAFDNSFRIFSAFFLITDDGLLVCFGFLLVLFFDLGQLLIEKKVELLRSQYLSAELLVLPGQCMDGVVFLQNETLIDDNLQLFLL